MASAHTPTTAIHDALPRFTLAIVAEVSDASAPAAPSAADAEVAVARLASMSTDLRGCAVIAADGSALAASGDLEAWAEAAAGLLAAADAAAGEPVGHLHVGTEDGEVFAVRGEGVAIVAASERFPLASLMLSDMRAVLRELAAAAGAAAPAEPRREAA